MFRNDRFGRGGDHSPFCEQGFTAVRICEFNENYDRTHKIPAVVNGIQEGDLPEYVDYEYVRKNAGINLATIANLALAPYEPANCGIVARRPDKQNHIAMGSSFKRAETFGLLYPYEGDLAATLGEENFRNRDRGYTSLLKR